MCAMTRSRVRHDRFIRLVWLTHMRGMTFGRVTWLTYMSDVTRFMSERPRDQRGWHTATHHCNTRQRSTATQYCHREWERPSGRHTTTHHCNTLEHSTTTQYCYKERERPERTEIPTISTQKLVTATLHCNTLQHSTATHCNTALQHTQHSTATRNARTTRMATPSISTKVSTATQQTLKHTTTQHCNTALQHSTATQHCNTALHHIERHPIKLRIPPDLRRYLLQHCERWGAGVEYHFQEFNEPYAPS